jgi:Putative MetA-pathway of phenol degradation
VATHSTIRFLAATLFWATSSQAAGPNEDLREKTGYNLFHPTPDSLLRELTTDRPDKTESPYTVDAGHYQIELDLLNYTQDCTDQAVQTLAIAPSNLKVGLFNNVDLQFIVETYTILRTSGHDPQAHETISGFGDVLIRCKTNFWGNDGGTTAGGMMPFLKLLTGATELGNGAVERRNYFPAGNHTASRVEHGADD